MDIHCCKCGEPWDAYGVASGDMEPEEARRFKRGEGCPACEFGTKCTACYGTGLEYDEFSHCACHGHHYLIVRNVGGRWERGYVPDVIQLTEREVRNMIRLKDYGVQKALDGYYSVYKVLCWLCTSDQCTVCKGTRKLQRRPDADEKEAIFKAGNEVLGGDPDGLTAFLEDLS